MLSREDKIWTDRRNVTRTELLFQAREFAVNLVVYCHYTLRRHEGKLKPETRVVLNQTLRAVKGVVTFWDRWLRATCPTSAPAVAPLPNDHEIPAVPSHANASQNGHDSRRQHGSLSR